MTTRAAREGSRVRRGALGLLAGGALALAGCTGSTGETAPPPAAASPAPAPAPRQVEAAPGGITVLALDPAFTGVLDRLGLAPRVSGAAGLQVAEGLLSLPATAGTLVVEPGGAPVAGEVRHEGAALLLTSGTTTVAVGDLVLDVAAGSVTADVAADGGAATTVPLLALDPAAARVTPGEAGEVLEAGRATLVPEGAEALNAAFTTDGFTPGAPVGALRLALPSD